MLKYEIEEVVKNALIEDMNNGDITTDNLIEEDDVSKAEMISKEDGVISGLDIAEKAFKSLDDKIIFNKMIEEGSRVRKGTVIAKIEGRTRAILSAERTALNLIQRLSGISTKASILAERISKYDSKLVDTRKTTPGLRGLEKYAVKIGGGHNHRFNLSDTVMIKDNHIRAVGGISEAVGKIRNKIPHTVKVEVEVETIEEFKEALDSGADIIMLDNMNLKDMKKVVEINNNKVILEASGNIDLDTIEKVAQTGVDIISSGGLTHSVKALDISLNIIY